jgi:hypothetical protein
VAGKDSLQQLEAAWRVALPTTPIAMEWIEAATPGDVVARALHYMALSLTAQCGYSGRLSLDLVTYRCEFERMQRCFAALEDYVTAQHPPAPETVFDYSRLDGKIDIGRVADTFSEVADVVAGVQQLLPVNSCGVAGLSIAIEAAPGVIDAPLDVALLAIETDETIAAWSLDPVTTRVGWVELVLERAIAEPALSLLLTVTSRPGTAGWSIAMGHPHPYAEYCAQTLTSEPFAAGESFGAPLALRIQALPPGTRVPVGNRSVAAKGARAAEYHPLSPADYETATEILAPGSGREESYTHYNSDAGFVQVHPRGGGRTTVARLLVAPPAGTWRVTARIRLAHESANPTMFALLVRSADGVELNEAEVAALVDGTPGFSGWTILAPMHEGRVFAVLPRPMPRAVAIYLLTRQDGGPEYGWARFSDVRLHKLPAPRGGVV